MKGAYSDFSILHQDVFLFLHDRSLRRKIMQSRTKVMIKDLQDSSASYLSVIQCSQAVVDFRQEYFDFVLLTTHQLVKQTAFKEAYELLSQVLNIEELNWYRKISLDLSLHLVYLAHVAILVEKYDIAARKLMQGMMYAVEYNESHAHFIMAIIKTLQAQGIDQTYYKQFKVSLIKQYEQYANIKPH
jgi:hypothetical protein